MARPAKGGPSNRHRRNRRNSVAPDPSYDSTKSDRINKGRLEPIRQPGRWWNHPETSDAMVRDNLGI